MTYSIVAEGLAKRYGDTVALDGVDLAVRTGSVFGLLGPNGAGKTTAVRILATLVQPDSGHATVGGHDVVAHAHQVRQLIGLAGQYAPVDESLTGLENLQLIGRLVGQPRPAAKSRARELLAGISRAVSGSRRGCAATSPSSSAISGAVTPSCRSASARSWMAVSRSSPSRATGDWANRLRDVGQGGAAPQGQRVTQRGRRGGRVAAKLPPAAGREPLEPEHVDLPGVQNQLVAGRVGGDYRPGQRAAEPGHQGLQRVGGVRGQVTAPQRVGQPRRRDHLTGLEGEQDQQGAQPRPAHLQHGTGVITDLQRPQHRYLHSTDSAPSGACPGSLTVHPAVDGESKPEYGSGTKYPPISPECGHRRPAGQARVNFP
jgi:energy-coupling factor transporter ATP-binding protein EcfA2